MIRSSSLPGASSTMRFPLAPGGGLSEIQSLVANVDNAVVFEKEVGTEQTTKLVSQVLRSGRQRRDANDSSSKVVLTNAKLRRDSSPNRSGFGMNSLSVDTRMDNRDAASSRDLSRQQAGETAGINHKTVTPSVQASLDFKCS